MHDWSRIRERLKLRTSTLGWSAERAPKLVIPGVRPTLPAFCAAVFALLKEPNTRVYFDTSLLMFLTKIGGQSRAELFSWLDQHCANRMHTPSWAAHEYLRHHSDKTLVRSIDDQASLISKTAKSTNKFVQEFLDQRAGVSDDRRVRAWGALSALDEVAAALKEWKETYPDNATSVIEFINRTVVDDGSIFSEMQTIQTEGLGRYDGRLPPGNRDDKKKPLQSANSETGEQFERGSNRYGDLMFWQETLKHAKRVKAKGIVILSNDRKDDWLMAGGEADIPDMTSIELNAAARPIPVPQPMLSYEARINAGCQNLQILDQHFLAQLLARNPPALPLSANAFLNVATIKVASRASVRETLVVAQKNARSNGLLFDQNIKETIVVSEEIWADPPGLFANATTLARALIDSKKTPEIGSDLAGALSAIDLQVQNGRNVLDVVDQDCARRLGHLLASLSRYIHDRAIAEDPGYRRALADLMSSLHRMPLNSASFLYIGLIASAYVRKGMSVIRPNPLSPDAVSLFALQGEPYAVNPNAALKKLYGSKAPRFVYFPDSNAPRIKVSVTASGAQDSVRLSHILIEGVHLTKSYQVDEQLSLNKSDETILVSVRELMNRLASAYCLPLDQLEPDRDMDQIIEVPSRAGFRDPVDLVDGGAING